MIIHTTWHHHLYRVISPRVEPTTLHQAIIQVWLLHKQRPKNASMSPGKVPLVVNEAMLPRAPTLL